MINFILTAILLALTPGPDNLYLLNLSIKQDKKAGVSSILGLCSGLVLHTMLAVLGIGALILSSSILFTGLKILGALYLLYLAYILFKQTKLPQQNEPKAKDDSLKALYLRGVFMNITNPKVLIFFLAFLPQFIDLDQNFYLQITLLGCLFILATFFVFVSLSLLAAQITHLLYNSYLLKGLNYLTAIVLTLVALQLVFH